MFKPFSKVLVVVALLIAFIGQALAYTAMPCEMSAGSYESHMMMEHSKVSYHEGMSHSDINNSSHGQSEDCCDLDCVCPANACTSVIFLNSDNDEPDGFGLDEAVLSQNSEQPKSISTSLYRPPIFA